jgi:methylmalonyl-CoA/ethylmalonyl-CoA epimerase
LGVALGPGTELGIGERRISIMIKKLRHIGVIVEDLDRAVKKFEGFGFTCSEVVEKKAEGIRIAFLPVGDTLIEFLSFSPEKGWDPVHSVVRSQKGALNHLCFEVDDLEVGIKEFERNGAQLLEGSPMPGAHGRVAFFDPKSTENFLVELCEV